MPYITQKEREVLLRGMRTPSTSGELNFMVTELIKTYLKDRNLNYQLINDIYGALEGAKFEFARRVVNNYEDQAKERNGDVY